MDKVHNDGFAAGLCFGYFLAFFTLWLVEWLHLLL